MTLRIFRCTTDCACRVSGYHEQNEQVVKVTGRRKSGIQSSVKVEPVCIAGQVYGIDRKKKLYAEGNELQSGATHELLDTLIVFCKTCRP